MTDEIMQELEAVEVFDETAVVVDRRLSIAKAQLAEWQEAAYSAKLSYQTNKELGHSPEELAPIIKQFTRSRNAVTYLQQQIVTLEQEARRPQMRPATV